jgi:hypothetical protein
VDSSNRSGSSICCCKNTLKQTVNTVEAVKSMTALGLGWFSFRVGTIFLPGGDEWASGWGRVCDRVGTIFLPGGDEWGESQRALTKNIWQGVLGSLGMPSMPGYPTKTIVPTRKPGNPTKNGEGPLPRGDEVGLCGPAMYSRFRHVGTSHEPAVQYSSPPLCCCRS